MFTDSRRRVGIYQRNYWIDSLETKRELLPRYASSFHNYTCQGIFLHASFLFFQCAQINRIPGLLDDDEMVGDIVWVKDNVSGVYWPGEALDPFNMPLGRSIPTEALSKLSSEQIRDSIPSLDGTWQPDMKSDARRIFVMFFPLEYAKWQV